MANTLLYEVPTYLAECSIETLNRKTKRKKAMENKKILKLTLEEYGYELDKLIFPADGLIIAISEAMDRARLDQCDKVVKKIEQRTNRIGMFYANEEKTYNLIKKL